MSGTDDRTPAGFRGVSRALFPGTVVFDRYRLVRPLGRGGFSIVWLAHDLQLEMDIALKFLSDDIVANPEALFDLKRETKMCLSLTHANIVRIHGFFESPDLAAIAMEYVDGGTMSSLKIRQPSRCFEPEVLSPYLPPVASALTYAHERVRVVHRDLKPGNLMVDRRGDIRIADFGISRSISDTQTRLSRQASSSGTPAYMGPQQMMGQPASVLDDVYSLGATLFDLVAGKPPFYTGAVSEQVLNVPPPTLAARRRELGLEGAPIPPAWEETVAACLAKKPQDRPSSINAVLMGLGLVPADPDLASAPPADATRLVSTPRPRTPSADVPPAEEDATQTGSGPSASGRVDAAGATAPTDVPGSADPTDDPASADPGVVTGEEDAAPTGSRPAPPAASRPDEAPAASSSTAPPPAASTRPRSTGVGVSGTRGGRPRWLIPVVLIVVVVGALATAVALRGGGDAPTARDDGTDPGSVASGVTGGGEAPSGSELASTETDGNAGVDGSGLTPEDTAELDRLLRAGAWWDARNRLQALAGEARDPDQVAQWERRVDEARESDLTDRRRAIESAIAAGNLDDAMADIADAERIVQPGDLPLATWRSRVDSTRTADAARRRLEDGIPGLLAAREWESAERDIDRYVGSGGDVARAETWRRAIRTGREADRRAEEAAAKAERERDSLLAHEAAPPGPPPPDAQVVDEPSPTERIEALLSAYERAKETLDVESFVALWRAPPASLADQLRRAYREYRSQRVELNVKSIAVAADGQSARVRFHEVDDISLAAGSVDPVSRDLEMHVVLTPEGDWKISSIE